MTRGLLIATVGGIHSIQYRKHAYVYAYLGIAWKTRHTLMLSNRLCGGELPHTATPVTETVWTNDCIGPTFELTLVKGRKFPQNRQSCGPFHGDGNAGMRESTDCSYVLDGRYLVSTEWVCHGS